MTVSRCPNRLLYLHSELDREPTNQPTNKTMRNLIASLALFVALAAQGQLIVNGNFENMGVWSLDGWTVAEGDSAWPE